MIESEILIQVQNDLTRLSTEDARIALAKFVPNSQNVYGVRLPIIKNLAKKYKKYGFSLIWELWYSDGFEEQMLAIKLLNKNCKKNPNLTLELLHEFSQNVNNWAICDTLCSEGIRPILKIKSREIWQMAADCLASNFMWVRHMGINVV